MKSRLLVLRIVRLTATFHTTSHSYTLQHPRTILLLRRHRAIAPRFRRIVERLDVRTPLVCIRSQHATVIR